MALGFLWLINNAKRQTNVIVSVPNGTSGTTKMFGGVSGGASEGNFSEGDEPIVIGVFCVNSAMTMIMAAVMTAELMRKAFLIIIPPLIFELLGSTINVC